MRFPHFETYLTLEESDLVSLFLARDDRSGRTDLELLLIHGSEHLGPRFERSFDTEMHRAASLKGPNLVSILEFGDCDEGKYVVTEHHEANSLAWIFEKRPALPDLPEEWGNVVVHEAASALAQAYECDALAVHGELSPQNILVGPGGEIRVRSWGIGKVLAVTRVLQTRIDASDFQYYSPEQMRGEATTVRSDLFALGLIWYEILSGKPLFNPMRPTDAYVMILDQDYASELENLDCSPEIRSMISKLLNRDPAKRYAIPSDFLADLHACASCAYAEDVPRRLGESLSPARGDGALSERTEPEGPVAVRPTGAGDSNESEPVEATVGVGGFLGDPPPAPGLGTPAPYSPRPAYPAPTVPPRGFRKLRLGLARRLHGFAEFVGGEDTREPSLFETSIFGDASMPNSYESNDRRGPGSSRREFEMPTIPRASTEGHRNDFRQTRMATGQGKKLKRLRFGICAGLVMLVGTLAALGYVWMGEERGRILVKSRPEGAQVIISGQVKGLTPIDLNLRPGIYELRLSLPGHREWSGNLRVVAGGEGTINRELEKIP